MAPPSDLIDPKDSGVPSLLVLEGATLLDGLGGPPRPHSVVTVRNGRIDEVGSVGQHPHPQGAAIEDLSGKFLIPGLIDAHAHAEADWVFSALLACGITQIRNPALCYTADPNLIEPGTTPRPAISSAGPAIDLAPSTAMGCVAIHDEAELRTEVRRQAQTGVDYVKLYTRLPPELVRAGIAEAHALGLKVIGDLSRTSWIEAARAGIDSLAHVLPRQPELLPHDARSDFSRDREARRPGTLWRWFELVDLDGPEIAEMIRVLVDHGVTVDPTLVSLEALLFADDPDFAEQVGSADELWPHGHPMGCTRAAPEIIPPTAHRSASQNQAIWRCILNLVNRLHQAGVPLLAGTDTPRPFVVPGASLHRELALLADGGLTCDQALAAATGVAAEALGIGSQTGTVQPGRRADLVLLRADPRDFSAARATIEWVMCAGCRDTPVVFRARYR